MRICNKCSAPKEEDKFEKGRNACKECRHNYAERKEYFLNYQKERRKDPALVLMAKETRRKQKDKENERNRSYREKNKDEINRKRREKRAYKK